jgi:predicted AAA+ superfamily ATPase
MIYTRNISQNILRSLKNNPVVLINGARQVGKSTLVEELIKKDYPAKYISFDDSALLFASSYDPFGFLDKYNNSIAIDEVQRNPEIFMAIKRIVDSKKSNGQFLLTGSANVLTIPKVSESLAGRMILHTLWPLSQGEIRGQKEKFIDWAFKEDKLPNLKKSISQMKLIDLIIKGGYPRSLEAEDDRDRTEWIRSYIDTILQRDIRDLSNIEGLKDMPHILSILAERIGNLINLADISRMIKLNQVTLQRYYALLQMVFLIIEIPAWFINRDKRLAKTPKIYLNDTGLACYFKQITTEDLLNERTHMGALLENFVVMELKKQITWHDMMPNLYHFRTQTGQEVDIVLEGHNKKIIGIEVKSSTKITDSDLRGLRKLKEIAGDKFTKGIILYTGEHPIALDKQLYALPINSLWDMEG